MAKVAYMSRVAVMANVLSGFRKSGIWLIDQNVFLDADFAPADVLTTNQTFNKSEGSGNKSNFDSGDEPLAH